MLIVDSQVHVWALDTPQRPWPKNRTVKAQRDVPLGSDELLREVDTAGVGRVVIVPPSWEGDRNDLGLAAAQAHPDRFAVMGRIDPVAPESRRKIADCLRPVGAPFVSRVEEVQWREPGRTQSVNSRSFHAAAYAIGLGANRKGSVRWSRTRPGRS